MTSNSQKNRPRVEKGEKNHSAMLSGEESRADRFTAVMQKSLR